MNVRVTDPFSSHETVSVAPLVSPVVVCGTSLWSMVRPGFSAEGERSPFHTTLATLATAGFRTPLVLAQHRNHRLVAKLLRQGDIDASALRLAEGASRAAQALRDIAAELAIADPDAVLMVVPDDMSSVSRPGLEQAIALALPAAREGRIVCFGLDSTRPATNHTWLQAGDNLHILANVQSVEVETDLAGAKDRHADASWFWNAGMYLVSARTLASLSDVNGRVETMLLAPADRLVMVKLDAGWSKASTVQGSPASSAPVTDTLADGKDFQVRRLSLAPGGSLDLTPQAGFSTHWTIVSGKARLKSRTGERDVFAGGSLSVPRGESHVIMNAAPTPLVFIEVQSAVRIGKASLQKAAA